MKYFIDFEFIEGFKKPLFGKRRHFIDLISVGIVCEDGREYSAISSEYKYKDADDWVKENVILPLFRQQNPPVKQFSDVNRFQYAVGKTNEQIASEIIDFIQPDFYEYAKDLTPEEKINVHIHLTKNGNWVEDKYLNHTQFYGYYSDYDWVLFCSLFGRMIDLPKGFPMYCIDLKQMLDEEEYLGQIKETTLSYDLSSNPNYPKQSNEHNALSDARWNYELYKFLKTL